MVAFTATTSPNIVRLCTAPAACGDCTHTSRSGGVRVRGWEGPWDRGGQSGHWCGWGGKQRRCCLGRWRGPHRTCSAIAELSGLKGVRGEPPPWSVTSTKKRRTNPRQKRVGASTFRVFRCSSYGASPRVPASCTHYMGPTPPALCYSSGRQPFGTRLSVPHNPLSTVLINWNFPPCPTSARASLHE